MIVAAFCPGGCSGLTLDSTAGQAVLGIATLVIIAGAIANLVVWAMRQARRGVRRVAVNHAVRTHHHTPPSPTWRHCPAGHLMTTDICPPCQRHADAWAQAGRNT